MKLEEATVLVVDDEQDLREIFSAWLGRRGCKVLTAVNGEAALKILTTRKIDVLVSDIRMPVMDGVELVRHIFEMKLTIPSIIFVSGFGDVEPREMYGLGVEALMEKPLSRKDLIDVLDGSLREREQLWLKPAIAPMAQRLTIEVASRRDAWSTHRFQLGRGGCSFSTDHPLAEERTIDLSISFVEEALCLKAQGTVRWYAQDDGHAGVSFDYLEPESREWILGEMRESMCRSFIPPCRG